MKFSDLCRELKISNDCDDFEVQGLTANSSKAQKGYVYFALPSTGSRCEDFCRDALERGAGVALKYSDFPDPALTFSQALQYFYKESFDNLTFVGVTGTNGKSSFCFMLRDLLEAHAIPTGIWGTIENSFQGNVFGTELTSPLAEDFYEQNHINFKKGMKVVLCEVSSHALEQQRLGINFLDIAVFTSFSQDHLDYHGDMNSYFESKVKILTEALKEGGAFFTHSHHDYFERFGERCPPSTLASGRDFKFSVLSRGIDGIRVVYEDSKSTFKGDISILGSYQGENYVLALAVFFQLQNEFTFEVKPDLSKSFRQIPGRMERFILRENAQAYVDFCHTPESLEKALATLRELNVLDAPITVVFGCGGERDKDKRAIMGEIACRYADRVILTDDNPRGEDPNAIVQQIYEGCEDWAEIEVDRGLAIFKALMPARYGDGLFLIAGKGHENYQERNGQKTFFSDRRQVLDWVEHYGN